MKFLMVSQCGEGAGVLKQIQDEGNACELYIKDELYESTYDGLLTKTKKIAPDKDTVVIFDMSGNGDIADDLKHKGHLVYGSSVFADDLEKNRKYGLEIMEAYGIKLPKTQDFDDFNDAVTFLEKNEDKRFVFKPSGTMPCKLTYCSKDNEELLTFMRFVDEQFGDKIDDFVLQEFVEGEVVSTEIYFDGNRVVGCPNHTVEVKKFMNDELGPSTGCSGNIMWPAEDSKIADKGVLRIIELLKRVNYVGPIDLNAVVNKTGVYGLEWTPRFGYDATPTYLKMLNVEYGKFFSDIVHGKAKKWTHNCESMCGIRFSIPPYPAEPVDTEEEKVDEALPNYGVPIQNWETYAANLYFYEVMLRDEQLQHCNGTGIIGVAIHKDPKRCYEILEKLKIPDLQYRTDLAKVLPKMKAESEKYA